MVTKTSHLPIRYFLALLWAHPILHISRIRVNTGISHERIVCEDCTQKPDNRKDACLHLLERIQSNRSFLKNVITGDETWIFEDDPETKRQSKEWHTSASPRPKKKARISKSKIKSMLICFFWQSRDCPYRICASRTNCLSVLLPWDSWKTKKKRCSRATKHC